MQLIGREVILFCEGRSHNSYKGRECDEDYYGRDTFSSFGFGVHF